MSEGGRCGCLRRNKLIVLTMGGVLCGVALGVLLQRFDPSETTLMWIGLPGELYIRFLKMLIIPLLITSVISGTSSLNANTSGKAGIITLVYFIFTNFTGCVIGCLLTVLIVPGTQHHKDVDAMEHTVNTREYHDLLADVFRLTPCGLFSLLAKIVSSTDNLPSDMADIAMYIVTVTVGQCLVVVLLVPLVYVIVRRNNPADLFIKLREPIMLSFVTGSTAAVIPDTVCLLEKAMSVDKHVAEFVVPLSTTIGRCGTSLYVSVACVFLLQTQTSESDAETVVLICLMATLLSTAAPSVSGSSMAVIILILSNFNVPSDMIAILFSTDWIIDRIRTITNYVVQVLGVIIINTLCVPSRHKDVRRTSDVNDLNTISLWDLSRSDGLNHMFASRRSSILSISNFITRSPVGWDSNIDQLDNALYQTSAERRPSILSIPNIVNCNSDMDDSNTVRRTTSNLSGI
ncbi:excitatory amino acid transporter 5-like [Ylistrum balloti]|uniref:excitatory amino acid transporter 5-like n=1 Tax=Ylistrum balloti TaxID=509963 RepID=UPI002905CC63|nr:excitatory amino acid transporter 5-like [Ylistrum balloti]